MPPKALARDPRPVRVRHEPPTLEEAVFAAQGLTDDVDQQTDIVAGLMEVPADEIRPKVAEVIAMAAKQAAARQPLSLNRSTAMVETRSGAPRAVVVEKTRRFKVSIPQRTVIDLTRRGASN